MSQSTFSANFAGGTGGGGIFNTDTSLITVTNSTFSGNLVSGNGGGILNFGTATVSQ